MYVTKVLIESFKLLRRVPLDLVHADGSPRQWTVFVGENGLCKTSILRAIALAASGPERASQLADVLSIPDRRHPEEPAHVRAHFSFHPEFHDRREYPQLPTHPSEPPVLRSDIVVAPGDALFRGRSSYHDRTGRRLGPPAVAEPKNDDAVPAWSSPLSEVRAKNLGHWFVAGYGVGRFLPTPQARLRARSDRAQDRLLSLFEPSYQISGPDFVARFSEAEREVYRALLEEALVKKGLLPNVEHVKLLGPGELSKATSVEDAYLFTVRDGPYLFDVPGTWLGQGHQGTIAWVADLVGQILLEARTTSVPLATMEGLVLIDEIDLHLHPKWQRSLIESLSDAFPKLQFIATTHSPMVLPGLKPDEVFPLSLDAQGNVTVTEARDAPRFMTGSELYDAFFDIQRVRAPYVEQALDEYGRIALDPYRSETEDAKLPALLQELERAGITPRWTPVTRITVPGEPGGQERP